MALVRFSPINASLTHPLIESCGACSNVQLSTVTYNSDLPNYLLRLS